MTSRVHQTNKKTGVTYVYESTSYWDKDKQQPRNKRICLGKLDPETGELIPSKRFQRDKQAVESLPVTASTQVIGPSIILDDITNQLDLLPLLKQCFPKNYRQIQTMAYYLAINGGALSQCQAWCKSHAPELANQLSSQRISEMLADIDLDARQTFCSKWMKQILEDDYLCYDITSISSYAEGNEFIRYGYNRDRDSLPQLNLAVLFGQKSNLPAYFEPLPGNITDVVTLCNLVKTFKALDIHKVHYIMDKGFYSKRNMDQLLDQYHKFVISVPAHNKWVQHVIDDVYEQIHRPQGYHLIDGQPLYIYTQRYSWGPSRRRCYLHLYYNATARAVAVDRFSEKLLRYKEELESGQVNEKHREAYDTYFIVKTTPKRGTQVLYNEESIDHYVKRYAGFQAILTNSIKDPVNALQVYRDKDVVEKSFDDLKNQLDMKRLRMHTPETVHGKLFIQFLALIYTSALKKRMRETKLNHDYSVRELLQEMAPLTKIKYQGRYGSIMTEVTKPQRDILKKLNITLPSKD